MAKQREPREPVLEVAGLVKTFPAKRNGPVRAVDNLSFQVNPGEVVGLLGPNGAGKTTTIKCILGLMRPTAGSVRVGGFNPHTQNARALTQVSAVLEGSRNIYWRLTVWENIAFFAGIQGISVRSGREYFEHLIELFRLNEKRNSEVRLLSQGMKQKAALACALAKRTPLVFLDEPTLGLDVETSYELRETLRSLAREEGRTLVVSSHDMDVIQDVCERVIIISNGHLVADEQVRDLLALFESRRYRLLVAGSPDGDLACALEKAFPQAKLSRTERQTVIEVRLEESRDIYRIVDLLREAGADLTSIAREQPDLEQAYLELVRKGREQS